MATPRNANDHAAHTVADRRVAAAAQATHRIAWEVETEAVSGTLIAHGGYAICDLDTGERIDFVRVSEWATPAETATQLRRAGYAPLGFALVRKFDGPDR